MKRINFNRDWLFWNEKEPRKVIKTDLPHDAMLTEKRIPGLKNGTTTGFYPGGRYYYEKRFFGDPSFEGKCVILEFDGIYMNSTVYLNGEEVGGHIYGYSYFSVELTDRILIGQENVIRVIADNTRTTNSRWYSGSGIYRDVRLAVGEKRHIAHDSLQVRTLSIEPARLEIRFAVDGAAEKEAGPMQARLTLSELGLLNGGDYGYLPEKEEAERKAGAKAAAVLSADAFSENTLELTVPGAKLWDENTPFLYALRVELLDQNGVVTDTEEEVIGIRALTWSPEKGLCVNSSTVKLKGACIHHDNGCLGACEYRKALLRKMAILKQVGFNAVRVSHHPASKALMDACDIMGMYMMEETFDSWRVSKNEYDYSIYFEREWKKDLAAAIVHSFNHPCVIMYSIGNEIGDLSTERGAAQNREMAEFVRNMDSTRPVTNAGMYTGFSPLTPLGKEKIKKGRSPEDTVDPYLEANDGIPKGSLFINTMVTILPLLAKLLTRADRCSVNSASLMDPLDISGFNYANIMMEELHRLCPDRLLLNSETYPKDIGHNWPGVLSNPGVVGDFMWTGWDYLGEVGAGVVEYGKRFGAFNKPYPCVAAGLGAVDMTGFIEAEGLFASAAYRFEKNPKIAVRPVNHYGEPFFIGQWRGTDAVASWSWEGCEGKKAEVEIYSFRPEVELFINGKSQGRKKVVDCKAGFRVCYEPGEIMARAYDDHGRSAGESRLYSAQKATVLTLQPEETVIRADGEDLAYVPILITDENGIQKALSDRRIHVTVTGAGRLAGIGSGNPRTTDDFMGDTCVTYYGRALAVIRSGRTAGTIRVRVEAEGLEPAEIRIDAV